ncbi:hypothetical protein FI667_g1339, partial [Globisporangium splendens]
MAKPKSADGSNLRDDSEPTTTTRDDAKWKKLVASCQKKSEYIADLEKHLVFYKSKVQQMQAQLQQLIRDSSKNCNQHSSDDDDEEGRDNGSRGSEGDDSDSSRQLRRRIQQLKEANDALMKDLATAKHNLTRSGRRESAAEGKSAAAGDGSSARAAKKKRVHVTSSKLSTGAVCVYQGCNTDMASGSFKNHFTRFHMKSGEPWIKDFRKYGVVKATLDAYNPTAYFRLDSLRAKHVQGLMKHIKVKEEEEEDKNRSTCMLTSFAINAF